MCKITVQIVLDRSTQRVQPMSLNEKCLYVCEHSPTEYQPICKEKKMSPLLLSFLYMRISLNFELESIGLLVLVVQK